MLTYFLSEIEQLKPPQPVRLVAVSKLQPEEKIRALHFQGQNLFAENYVQELLLKQERLKDLHISWHFIGKLQRNKVKQLVGLVDLIHSVDSIELAEEINKRAEQKNIRQGILWQLNLAQEATKAGNQAETLLQDCAILAKLPHLYLKGLMTMPPLFNDPEETRPYFRQLKNLRDQLCSKHPDCIELSMGTSSDWRIAVQEGASLIRIGTALFGARIKT